MFTAFHILVILQEKAVLPQKGLESVVHQLIEQLPHTIEYADVGELDHYYVCVPLTCKSAHSINKE